MTAPDPRTERKVVTVLFADLVGFTSRAEQLDPEDVEAILRPYHERLRGELERYGGTVEKFIGDAVMAVFGAPVAHEDDPERAVRAALSIRDAFAGEEGALELRIGVNTGEALVRLGAYPETGQSMVAGDVVNTAARLQSAAPENGILVGEATFRATDRSIEYRKAEPVHAKGKTDPVPVYEAVAARSRLGVDVPDRAHTPLVGRTQELDVLTGALARARAGAPQLVTLVGVPGIGKSRLVHELFRVVGDDPELIFWRQGRSLPYGTGVTYWALAEMAKAHAGILESDTAEAADEKLLRVATDLGRDEADAAWLAGHLRPLVGLAGDGAPAADRREESFAAWRRLLEAIAETGPLVLVFEDLHWADDGLLDFVDVLVDRAAPVPLLVVCTARPELLERRPGWGGGKRDAATLSLAPLSDEETARLVAGLLARPVLEAETQSALLERAGGNPLYAEEFVRMLADRGDAGSALPETVQGIIAARLDLLPDEEKSLVLDAAVLGKVVWSGALAHVSGRDRFETGELLHRLERKEFLRRDRRTSVAGEDEYAFLHALVRDVAYAQLPRAARAQRHSRVAEWLESLPADRSEDRAEMLAHHYVSALDYAAAASQPLGELPGRARAALREAGDRATALNAFPAAAEFYRRALELVPADDDPGLLFVYACAAMMTDVGGSEEAARAADLFLSRGEPDGAARALLLAGEIEWRRGHAEPASGLFDRAAGLVAGAPDSETKAHALSELSRFRMLAGRNGEAIELGRDALALAEAFGLRHIQADTLNNVGVTRVITGDEGGLGDLELSIEIAREIGWVGLYRAYINLASVTYLLGGVARAQELHVEGLRHAERIEFSSGARWLWAELALDTYALGRWDESRAWTDRYVTQVEASGPHYMEHVVRGVRAVIAAAEGDLRRAADESGRGIALARDASDPQALLPAIVVAAFISAQAGSSEEARTLLDEALQRGANEPLQLFVYGVALPWLADRLDRRAELAGLLESAPRSRWIEAARAWAADDLARAADLYGELGSLADEAWARLTAAERLTDAGRPAEAEPHLAKALAFYRSVGATGYVLRAEALLRESA